MIDLTSNETVLLHDDTVAAAVAPKVNDQAAFSLSRWQITCLHWLIIAAVAAIVTRVMWAPALLWGHSAWFDLTRMVEFDAAIRAGDYWPLWAPDFYRGYGSPIFQFYAPLVYFLAEIPVLAGCNIATALKITQLVLLLGSGVAMYHFAAVHVSRWAACCGAVLYMVAPYRMLDLFARHALAEHAAFVWLPLLALGTERFISTRRRVGAALAILATAGLILTHNVMALLGLPVCVAAGCLLSGRMREWRSVFFAACPAVIGVGLSAFFWWPALTGRGFTKAEQSLTGGFFDFHQHFVTARELLDPAWAFADSGATVAAQMPLHIGVPHLIGILAATFFLFKQQRLQWSCVGIAIALGGAFMCHESSRAIWDAVPLLKYVQFPWRFLALVVFGASICGAALIDRVAACRPRLEVAAFAVALVAVLTAYLPYYENAEFVVADPAAHSFVRVTSDELAARKAAGALLDFETMITPASLRSAQERATSSDDFLPEAVREKPPTPAAEPISTIAGEIRECLRPARNDYRATIAMRESGQVQLHQFWFPGWSAAVDGQNVPAAPFGSMAIVSCNVSAGEHVVEFRYEGMPQRRAALLISYAAALCAAVVIVWPRMHLQVRNRGAV